MKRPPCRPAHPHHRVEHSIMATMQSDLEQRIANERAAITALDSALDSTRIPYMKSQLRFAGHMLDDAVSALRHADKVQPYDVDMWIGFAETNLQTAAPKARKGAGRRGQVRWAGKHHRDWRVSAAPSVPRPSPYQQPSLFLFSCRCRILLILSGRCGGRWLMYSRSLARCTTHRHRVKFFSPSVRHKFALRVIAINRNTAE